MNSKDLPIQTKTVESILAVAKAQATRRYDLNKGRFTQFWEDLDLSIRNNFDQFVESKNELGHLLYYRDDKNWTFLTSHKLVGRKKGKLKKVNLRKIRNTDFGMVKNMDHVPLDFKVMSSWRIHVFEYESNGPGFILMNNIDYIQNHWERKAIDLSPA